MSVSVREAGPVEHELHERYATAHVRLFRAPAPATKPKVPTPLSPFNPRRRLREAAEVALAREDVKEIAHIGDLKAVDEFWPPVPSWKKIAQEVAAKHGVSIIDIRSPRRSQHIVRARYEAFWRCRTETLMSLPMIGRVFGGRDHTTVLHGVRAHEKRLKDATA